jgi:hypothetical protein
MGHTAVVSVLQDHLARKSATAQILWFAHARGTVQCTALPAPAVQLHCCSTGVQPHYLVRIKLSLHGGVLGVGAWDKVRAFGLRLCVPCRLADPTVFSVVTIKGIDVC